MPIGKWRRWRARNSDRKVRRWTASAPLYPTRTCTPLKDPIRFGAWKKGSLKMITSGLSFVLFILSVLLGTSCIYISIKLFIRTSSAVRAAVIRSWSAWKTIRNSATIKEPRKTDKFQTPIILRCRSRTFLAAIRSWNWANRHHRRRHGRSSVRLLLRQLRKERASPTRRISETNRKMTIVGTLTSKSTPISLLATKIWRLCDHLFLSLIKFTFVNSNLCNFTS